MNTLHVKTGDTVVVLSGKDKGKQGKVLSASPKNGTVVVEGINIAQKHTKPRRQGEQGGIVAMPIAMHACKVMRVCPQCQKPTRPAHKVGAHGQVTVCKKCGAEI